MMNSSLGDLEAAENSYGYPNASDSYGDAGELTHSNIGRIALRCIILIMCCIGFVGNGCIIWLLGFQIKRNSFTTFILNLAIADFGYLLSTVIIFISTFSNFKGGMIFKVLCIRFTQVMYFNANFVMTAISIDRFVAVLFPIWHRCSRPKHLSPAVCAFLWICSFLLIGMMVITELAKVFEYYNLLKLHVLAVTFICLPLVTLSTGVLFFKVCLKSNQRNQGRLLLTILITFLCFLILGFPLCAFVVINMFYNIPDDDHKAYWFLSSILLSCLNSSINPVIYFLVGRKKEARSKKSMKVILQNAFREGEAT